MYLAIEASNLRSGGAYPTLSSKYVGIKIYCNGV